MPEALEDQTEETTEQETPEVTEEEQETPQEDPETFPKSYVEKLRKEAADARTKAKRAEELEASLFTERVRATGRLADPTDLALDVELLDDAEALSAAIDALLAAKPHLTSRTPRGDVGQGVGAGSGGDVDLAGLLRMGA